MTGRRLATADAALTEFFEREGHRFSVLEPLHPPTDHPSFTFSDAGGLAQLRVELTDEHGGCVVAGYSYCTD